MQDRFNDIINYWFQNTQWFDKSNDNYITEKYKDLVDSITTYNYKSYITDMNSRIALLVIGDQFTRNIYRHDMKERYKNDIWALELALSIINDNLDLTYPLNYRYFILLPLRHNKTSVLLDLVCSRINIYIDEFTPIPQSLIQFYTNTIQNYTYLVDKINIGMNIPYQPEFNEILEQNIPEEYHCPDIISHNMRKPEYQSIGLSLSGGVDSMVLLNCLVLLSKTTNSKVVAIHIEHCNRKEAVKEREFLEYYCNMLNIKLYYRTIYYINRSNDFIDRNIIEEETKKARFNLYKYVIEKEGLSGIILGHHMGDIVENVFTNIIKGRNLENITVMEEENIIYDVKIFRPFLNITKNIIYEYAHYNKIPYFLNSTPVWSCRGVLRDQIIPLLKKQFGEFEHNIIKFTQNLSEMSSFYKKEMDRYIITLDTNKYTSKIIFNSEYLLKEQVIDMLLLKIMHGYGYHMISKKSRKNLIRWLKGNKDTMIDLDKNVFCYYNIKNNYLYFVNYTVIINENINKAKLLEIFDNIIPNKIKINLI